MDYSVLNFKSERYSSYLNDNIYDLLDRTFIIPDDYSYNIFRVTSEYIARPDLISIDAYGDDSHVDVICKLNGISNPFELNEGMHLIMPTPDCISDFYYHPSNIYDKDENWGMDSIINNSSQKNTQKNIKRKVSDVIAGVSNYTIDEAGGVIIY